jgi:hypothetical protein
VSLLSRQTGATEDQKLDREPAVSLIGFAVGANPQISGGAGLAGQANLMKAEHRPLECLALIHHFPFFLLRPPLRFSATPPSSLTALGSPTLSNPTP